MKPTIFLSRGISGKQKQVNDIMTDKKLFSNEITFLMSDLATLIYQVTDFDVALDMVLDTYVEYFKIDHAAIARYHEDDEQFVIIKSREFDQELQEKLRFNLFTSINGYIIRKERPSRFDNLRDGLKIGEQTIPIASRLEALYFIPFRFHEQVNAFLIVAIHEGETGLPEERVKLLSSFTNLMAPVFHAFGSVKRRQRGFENIISKIIKDRIYEARLGLYPVSFAIFRLSLWHEMISTVALEDTVRSYQELFDKKLASVGDVIWLTLDTAFFIFPNADLFTSESLCSNLKNEMETLFAEQKNQIKVDLKYVTISYPQSGEDAGQIISQLWLRLFDELRGETFTGN